MKAHCFPVVAILSSCIVYALFISSPVASANESCDSLMKSRCLSCHFETRICQKLKKNKGKRSWKRTIKSMVRHGAELTNEEQKILVQCFAKKDTEILSLCGMDK
jgi:hypothetical protein